jgi:hypothetical protein
LPFIRSYSKQPHLFFNRKHLPIVLKADIIPPQNIAIAS